uniref:Transposase n=1 Tax=Loa loa TaxID=7209 RepID=A0A1I7V6B0_LOALO
MSFARTIIPPRQLRMSGLNYDDYDADDLIGRLFYVDAFARTYYSGLNYDDYDVDDFIGRLFFIVLLSQFSLIRRLMEGEFVNASGIGPNLPNLADLKKYLREEKPLYFQVLEQYLRNAANL